MDGEDGGLKLEIRRKIFYFISEHPALHEREIARQLNLPLGTLDYHLYYLKKRRLIIGKSDGHYTRYYVIIKIGRKDKIILSVIRQKAPRSIVLFLLLRQFAIHRTIHNHIGLSASTTSFHLDKLVKINILERKQLGRETRYWVKDPEYISDLVITYKKSFLDDAVNRFVDTWFELHPKHLRKAKK